MNIETLYLLELYQNQMNKDVEEFYKTYLKHFWNIEEFSNRYIEHNLLLHYYLDNLGINHYFFNRSTKVQVKTLMVVYMKSIFISKRRGLLVFSVGLVDELKMVHGIMDELVFHEFKNIFKNNFLQLSFKKYCDNIGLKWGRRYVMNHPNEKIQ